MFEIVNESPAPYFYEQMRIRKALALEDWDELHELAGEFFYQELLLSFLTFDDIWQREQNWAFQEMTANCIRELRRRCVMELS